MTHAGTTEREILDYLLTDRQVKALDRGLVERMIEWILELSEIESLRKDMEELEDQNFDLADKVNQLEYKLDGIQDILDS